MRYFKNTLILRKKTRLHYKDNDLFHNQGN